jgi:hypothetical protein
MSLLVRHSGLLAIRLLVLLAVRCSIPITREVLSPSAAARVMCIVDIERLPTVGWSPPRRMNIGLRWMEATIGDRGTIRVIIFFFHRLTKLKL